MAIRKRSLVLLVVALIATGCSSPAPDAETPAPELEAPPEFDGVVGRDWVQVPTEQGSLSGAYAIRHGLGSLWALRDDDGTDSLITSTDGMTWVDVPLDPRLPDDIEVSASLYVDDERIVVAYSEQFDERRQVAPWIAIGDGEQWEFLAPDEIGRPSVQGSLTLWTSGISGIAPVGDSLVFLVGASWYDGGSSTIPCACSAPLVVHPDGSIEWNAVQGSALGQLDSFGGEEQLVTVDDGVLLVTTWGDDASGQKQVFHVFHSADGLTWEDRSAASSVENISSTLAPIARSESAWLTATIVSEGFGEPEQVVLLASPDGIDWEAVYNSESDEFNRIRAVVAGDEGFYAFPLPPTGDRNGADVLYSPDAIEWTAYSNALKSPLGSLGVESAVAVEGGLVVLTFDDAAPLWVSGQTPYTPTVEE